MENFILLAIFIKKNKLKKLLSLLEKEYDINKAFIFIVENNDEILITFSTNKKILIPKPITGNKPIHIHRKNKTLFSINGLNKYIETISDIDNGNIDYKNIPIEWDKLNNVFILKRDNILYLNKIKKVTLNELLLDVK